MLAVVVAVVSLLPLLLLAGDRKGISKRIRLDLWLSTSPPRVLVSDMVVDVNVPGVLFHL